MPQYQKGHKRRPDKDHLFALSHAKHGTHLRALQAIQPPPSWDTRALGFVGPVKDQGQCGSCWDFSGTGIVEIAHNKSGLGGGTNIFILSEEYSISCYRNGQCQGDDNTTVLDWAKSYGLPLEKDYGPYVAAPAQCTYVPGIPLYSIDDWGFASSSGSTGVASIADIKAAIMQYGAVGAGIAADDGFQAYAGGVFRDTGARSIDHDIILVGWDDAANSWILRNSWGPNWGEAGYMRIDHGANAVGDEAVWTVKHP